MLHYIKFFHYYFIVGLAGITLLMGQHFILIGFALFVAVYAIGDALLGDDLSQPALKNKRFLNLMLYGAIPLSITLLLVCAWIVSPYDWPIMHSLSKWTNYDFIGAKANTSTFELLVGLVFAGLMLSGVATVVGHELVHRIGSKTDVCLGRWLMSMSFDANFSIEHVYHHHAKVATESDPVTAPRGRNVYVHVIYALIGTNKSAWKIETKRLSRKQQSVYSPHNRFIRGWLMTVTILLLFAVFCGWQSALYVAMVGLIAKLFLEIVNYMEHYGLVRDPKQMVKPKHSWNSNKKISCWAMFNLPRHSHHHAQGAVPFEKLQPMPEAPLMISGYISTLGLTLIPPLWFALMKPKLAQWDKEHANERELAIIKRQADDKRVNPLVAFFY